MWRYVIASLIPVGFYYAEGLHRPRELLMADERGQVSLPYSIVGAVGSVCGCFMVAPNSWSLLLAGLVGIIMGNTWARIRLLYAKRDPEQASRTMSASDETHKYLPSGCPELLIPMSTVLPLNRWLDMGILLLCLVVGGATTLVVSAIALTFKG